MGYSSNLEFIIGIDVGTTNIKGSLYSSNGDLIVSERITYESYTPKENYHEQNPDDWVNGFIEILNRLLISDEVKINLKSIALSTQGGTFVIVDKDFKPLCNAITWLDKRSVKTLNENTKLLSLNSEFYDKTGWRLDTCLSFMPLYWLKENKKEIFNKIHKVLYVNDYVYKKITGMSFQDPSNAALSLLFNISNGRWDKSILKLLDFDESKFSEVKNSGYLIGFLNENICKKLGIRSKVKIINGGHDKCCAEIGAGIFEDNQTLIATGTAWGIGKNLNKPIFDFKNFFIIERSILKDKYAHFFTISTAGASLKWFAKNIMNFENEKKLFEIIDNNTEKIMKIKNNILYFPYLTGNFGPDFDINRKASFLNVGISHNYLDFTKAIMEGIGFQVLKFLSILKKKGIGSNDLKMVDGAAKCKIWPQIVADITNIEVLVPENKEIDFCTKGAAIIAGYGAEIFSSFKDGYNRLQSKFTVIKPDLENVKFYKKKYKLFLNN